MHKEKVMRGNVTYGDVVHMHLWYVTAERYEPDLVCQALRTQVDGNGDAVNEYWREVEGPVTLLTEEQRRVDPSGLAVGVVDTRTRLVVRRHDDPEGNGSPVGFEPLVIDPTGEDTRGLGDYRTLRFVRRVDTVDRESDDTREVRREARRRRDQLNSARALLQSFVDERIERTELDTRYVRLPDAHAAYLTWCNERHVRPEHRLEYHDFTEEVARLGYLVSHTPRTLAEGRHEYVIERAYLLDR